MNSIHLRAGDIDSVAVCLLEGERGTTLAPYDLSSATEIEFIATHSTTSAETTLTMTEGDVIRRSQSGENVGYIDVSLPQALTSVAGNWSWRVVVTEATRKLTWPREAPDPPLVVV
jgi:hypothetical protein